MNNEVSEKKKIYIKIKNGWAEFIFNSKNRLRD